jgi:hypothetical protein
VGRRQEMKENIYFALFTQNEAYLWLVRMELNSVLTVPQNVLFTVSSINIHMARELSLL